jgi:hypothetical protein
MSYSFKDLPQGNDRKKGKFIRPGSGLVLKVNDIILEKSQNHEFRKPVLMMETEPITEEGWEGEAGAKGQIGKIAANGGYYLKTPENQKEFVVFLRDIARALGKLEQCSTIEADTLEDFIEKVKPIICDGTYGRYFVRGQEYPKPNSNIGFGIKLLFPKFKFVESMEVEAKDTKLEKFDKANKWHYDAIPKAPVQKSSDPVFGESEAASLTEPVDDLPF